jgi:hypothetical protein
LRELDGAADVLPVGLSWIDRPAFVNDAGQALSIRNNWTIGRIAFVVANKRELIDN